MIDLNHKNLIKKTCYWAVDNMDTEGKIKQLFDLFAKFGHENYIGEEVSQLQHAQQCAQEALKSGQADHAVLGAFLHDVGHLVGLVNKMEVMFASDGKALGTVRWSTLS